ncbi:4a-hydroxytetrahydrobiopterin dehydratase [Mumia sp. zg.B53]|uniref:4a-hydroxytetrahydrobiopterin dehydratase n=1 Tax=unclassified Mumia TaxID=2621872 RepID=UPI001C6E2EBB|nr:MULTISPECIES: 4a-hydroxytetrahydrobiopterin dehydratase [unclassified Mumia]MBW9210899.1 4a-hydroxytetrahydrobiopterin dehydratase [Mumia sp. zg.B21]MBW9215465.1 4a-hydroxytetrahydrobiopterin dehydratase [Mumia sp. zg.B53]MDD9350157.1 4a-hydroxytetrahydrobiopterin dehydratase [Mumia sp.]
MDQSQLPDTLLSEAEITSALASLPAWVRDGDTIVRSVRAPSYLDGIALVDAVAAAAEIVDHHPDIMIRWRDITFTLSTHSSGGLSARDIALARQIDAIAEDAEDR